jgi:hypothetical protein
MRVGVSVTRGHGVTPSHRPASRATVIPKLKFTPETRLSTAQRQPSTSMKDQG